jgi:hypothetical protein
MTLPYLTLAGAIAAALALLFAIRWLIRRAHIDALARLPIAREHRVELPAGDVILHLSGPLGKIGLGRLSFALVDAGGASVPSAPIVLRTRRSTSLRNLTLSVRRFSVPVAGAYRFQVAGIPPDRDLSDCGLVLARPQGPLLAVAILAVVFTGVMLIVFTVLTLLLWLSPEARDAVTTAMAAYAA